MLSHWGQTVFAIIVLLVRTLSLVFMEFVATDDRPVYRIDKTVTKRTKCETGLRLNCNKIMLFIPENIKHFKEQIIFQNDFYFKKTKTQLCSTKNNVLLYCLKV